MAQWGQPPRRPNPLHPVRRGTVRTGEGVAMSRRLIRVVGSCLAPKIQSGDLVYVDDERPGVPGDVVVATLGGGSTLIGELAEWSGRRWLVGRVAEPLRVGGSIAIVGVAEAFVRPL